ncbi:MAG: alpha/beta hydrolase [Bacteroidota bacterium]
MKFIRFYLKILSLLSPKLTVRQVYHFMSNPRIYKLREREEVVLAKSKQATVPFRDFQLKKYEWGNPTHRKVLLVHGWQGQAGNFAALIDVLLDLDYYVLAFDAPSHGKSSKRDTSMFEFGDFVADVVSTERPEVVISHSFGSVSTASALRQNPDVPIAFWLVVTTPFSFRDRVQSVINRLGMSDKIMHLLLEKVENDRGESIDELVMDYYCQQLPHVKDALVVHSQQDRVIPIADSRRMHRGFPQSRLLELDGLGHYSILWSAELKEIVKDELSKVAI